MLFGLFGNKTIEESVDKSKYTSTKKDEIVVDGEFPSIGSLFLWSEPTATTVGVVKFAAPDKIILQAFKDSDDDKEREFQYVLENGALYFINSSGTKSKEGLYYVKDYFSFYNTAEQKREFLQKMIDFKETSYIPKLEKELKYNKEKLNKFIELRDGLLIP